MTLAEAKETFKTGADVVGVTFMSIAERGTVVHVYEDTFDNLVVQFRTLCGRMIHLPAKQVGIFYERK